MRALRLDNVDTDTRIVGAVAALYLILALVLLPASDYPRAVGSGLAVFALVVGIARTVGRGVVHGMSVFAVAIGSALVLVVPAFGAEKGVRGVTISVGIVGVQTAVLLWASCRWRPRPPADTRTSLGEAWIAGLLGATGLSLIATIPLLLTVVTGGLSQVPILLVYPAYFAGFLSAATVYWLLQRVAHLAAGRYLMGVLGGFCVYAAVAPVVAILRGEPFDLEMMVAVASIAGGLVGPAVALELDDH